MSFWTSKWVSSETLSDIQMWLISECRASLRCGLQVESASGQLISPDLDENSIVHYALALSSKPSTFPIHESCGTSLACSVLKYVDFFMTNYGWIWQSARMQAANCMPKGRKSSSVYVHCRLQQSMSRQIMCGNHWFLKLNGKVNKS